LAIHGFLCFHINFTVDFSISLALEFMKAAATGPSSRWVKNRSATWPVLENNGTLAKGALAF
jgi:hypothetical protein